MISNDKDQTEFILLLANLQFAKILWNLVTRLIPQEFFAFNGENIQRKKGICSLTVIMAKQYLKLCRCQKKVGLKKIIK